MAFQFKTFSTKFPASTHLLTINDLLHQDDLMAMNVSIQKASM